MRSDKDAELVEIIAIGCEGMRRDVFLALQIIEESFDFRIASAIRGSRLFMGKLRRHISTTMSSDASFI